MSRIRRHGSGACALLLFAALVLAAPLAAEELALIDDIVVDGESPEEPTADNLTIVVAATGTSQAGRRGMGLSAGDEVRTGEGVQAVLRFLNLDSEVDPLVFVDEASTYQITGPTTLTGLFGRLFASVAGLFSVITPAGRLGVEGTEFDVLIDDGGGIDIRVLEGVVSFAPGAAEETAEVDEPEPGDPTPTEPSGRGIEIRAVPGARQAVQVTLMLANGCPEPQSYFVDSTAGLPWVHVVADPQPIEVSANARAEVEMEVWTDTAGIEPGIYQGAIQMRCPDCGDCALTRQSAPLRVEVQGADPEAPALSGDAETVRRAQDLGRRLLVALELDDREKARAVAQAMAEHDEEWARTVLAALDRGEMERMRELIESPALGGDEHGRREDIETPSTLEIEALERVSLEGGAEAASPEKMAEPEVVEVLDWTDEVFVAVQPTYPAAGDAPHFDDVGERSREFRAARFDAIWKDDPRARAKLGNVYKDWGEDRRASKEYEEAAAADTSLERSADFVASWAEANRRAGRLEKAQEQVEKALSLDPESGRANVALGNVYRGYAEKAVEEGVDAEPYLELSATAYQAASGAAERSGDADARKLRGVAETNLAETYTALARSAIAKGQTAEADRRLVEAQQAVRAADSVYSKAQNPHLYLAEGLVLQERARLAKERGDEAASAQQLEQARQSYAAALQNHKDMAPAQYRIATVYEDKGDTDRAEREYEKAVEKQPTHTPTYQKLGTLKEVKSPGSGTVYIGRDLKLVPRVELVLEPPNTRPVPRLIGMELRQAEHAIVESGFTLGDVGRGPSEQPLCSVAAQNPAAGVRAKPGTGIDLTLALPAGSFAMPDLRGLDLEEARQRILDHGLGPVSVRRIEKRGRTRTEITGQSPRPGSKVSVGRAVELELSVPKPIKVPEVVGRSQREAVEKLEREGFVAGETRREPSCETAGRVVGQSPAPGARATPGSPVALVIATPALDARPVPGVLGAELQEAEELLVRAGFRLAEVSERESERPAGTVLGQQPAPETALGAGCPVALTVARPPALVEVPNFVGQPLDEIQRAVARVALAIAGIEIGRVTWVENRQFPGGTVVDQSRRPGSRVPRGSRIDLVVARQVSAPPPPTPTPAPTTVVPNLKCFKAERAVATLKEIGLRHRTTGDGVHVVRQSPAAGSRVERGTVVSLHLDYCPG